MTDAELLALAANTPKRSAALRVTAETVEKIRALASQGLEQSILAQRFALQRSTISNIVHRRGFWK